jgi:hypothetical protein
MRHLYDYFHVSLYKLLKQFILRKQLTTVLTLTQNSLMKFHIRNFYCTRIAWHKFHLLAFIVVATDLKRLH